MKSKWKYYNYAVMPTCAPHEPVDSKSLGDEPLWKSQKTFLHVGLWILIVDMKRRGGIV